MNDNAKALSVADNEDMDVIKENVRTLHEETGTVLSDIDDGENETIRFCKLVTDRPALTFGIGLGAHVFMLMITAILLVNGYDILPIDFKDVPLQLDDDPTKLRNDAWQFASENEGVTTLTGGRQLRGVAYQTIQMVYEIKGGNVFSQENLKSIQKFEDETFNSSDYQNHLCQLQLGNGKRTCKKPLSILRFFDGSYKDIHKDFYDPDFKNIANILSRAKTINLSRAILNYHLGKVAVVSKNKASSSITRSLLYIGWPFKGYNNTNDRKDDQKKEIDKKIVDIFGTKLRKKYEDGVDTMDFFYDNEALNKDALERQVIFDMALAIASFCFIFIFMWLQTGSLWLTTLGVFSILSSFNITNLIYRIVFDYRYFGVFHVLSIFIILGIGSDNIFVFTDTWKQSEKENHNQLSLRLSRVYRRAAKATFITSFTTMVAFLSNVPSPLLAISSFGLFSAILVMINYLSVILFFPTVMVAHHVYRKGHCCCGCPITCCKRDHQMVSSGNGRRLAEHYPETKSATQHVVEFFEGWFFKNIINHKITRLIVIFILVLFLAVLIVFATKLEPNEEKVEIWGANTNWGKIKNLRKNEFLPSQEDQVIVVYIIWGLKEQDRSECHHTDYKCKGKTVLDKSLDLNPPPCQNSILRLCKKLRNLRPSVEEKLHLRRSQVNGEVEINCVFERMNEYFKREENKTKYKDADFSFPLNGPKMRKLMKENPQLYNVSLLRDTYYRYFEVGVGYFITDGGSVNYASTYDFKKYSEMLGGAPDPTSNTVKIRSPQGNEYGNRLVYFAIAVNTSLDPATLGYSNGLSIYNNWENFVQQEMDDMPSSCNGGFQATVSLWNEWHWLKVQKILVQNAFQGIAIGLCLSLVVLIVATSNVYVGLLATIIIAVITSSVLGMIPIIGWKLGVLESLNLTLVVGLAVDYVVHLAEGYIELTQECRQVKVKHTLGHVGISVLSGACSTLGASIFMLAAKIVFFFKFGIFIFCTISFSILFSLFLFTPLLSLAGPENDHGSLFPLVRRFSDYLRGKTSQHVDCNQCRGKGYLKLTTVIDNVECGEQNTVF